jgi:hypothetical protein
VSGVIHSSRSGLLQRQAEQFLPDKTQRKRLLQVLQDRLARQGFHLFDDGVYQNLAAFSNRKFGHEPCEPWLFILGIGGDFWQVAQSETCRGL